MPRRRRPVVNDVGPTRRSRGWCFTLNNFLEADLDEVKAFIQSHRYGIFQQERGENGTLHLQGYVYAEQAISFNTVRRMCGGRAHWESAHGTAEENRVYCSKESTRVPGTEFWEHGECPRQGRRSDMSGAIGAVLSGQSLEFISAQWPDEWVKYHRGLCSLRTIHSTPRNWITDVWWLYGPTGSGKTRFAADECERLGTVPFWKMGRNKWWDGYDGHESVIIDDFRLDHFAFDYILRLFDRYPMRVETKGGVVQFVARRIYVTTPHDVETTFGTVAGNADVSGEDLGQLRRRIGHVIRFPQLGTEPTEAAQVDGGVATEPFDRNADFVRSLRPYDNIGVDGEFATVEPVDTVEWDVVAESAFDCDGNLDLI